MSDVTEAPEPFNPDASTTAAAVDEPRRRLSRSLIPRGSRGEILAGLLCAVLGFALVVQVQQTQEADLGSLRDSDLVRILDDLGSRNDRLVAEQAELEETRQELVDGGSAQDVARGAAQQQVDLLGILAGTAPATGPGIRLTINDGAGGEIGAATLLDAVQELRDSGAEALQVGDQRIVASTFFEDTEDGVAVDGTLLDAPYVFRVIGDPQTLSTALDIPGGVIRSVRNAGGQALVSEVDEVVIDALRSPTRPEYARPAEPTATP